MLKYVAIVVILATVSIAAQNAPYFGSWTFQPAKSDLGPVQITFAQKAAGQYIWTDDLAKRTYTFGIDGKSYTDPYGMSVVWTQQNPRTWLATTTANGKQVAVETYTLSPDGKSLTDHVAVATGANQTQDVTMTRVGGGEGLAGTWRGKIQVSPYELDIESNGPDGLSYRVPGVFEVKAMFDGKPYPMTGPLVVNATMATFTRTGPRAFHTHQTEGGKTTFDATATVSDDGKTLTIIGVNEQGEARLVFTRKS